MVNTELPLGDRSMAIFVVSAVMMSLSLVAVALRSFVRLYLVRAFGWDDALMVTAMLLFIFLNVFCMVGAKNGVGHRMVDFTSLDGLQEALLWWWLGQMLYIWSSAVTKISIALALLRLAVRKFHRIVLWSVIGIVIAIGLMFWLVLLLDCQPISYFWRRVNPFNEGHCLSTDILLNIAYLYSSLTILCDLILGAMPALLIWNLQMSGRTKVALAGILSLGAVASIAVIIRLPFLHFYADTDFLYSTYQIAIWSVMETGLGIVAGSLVTLRPLFRWFLGGTVSYKRTGPRERRTRTLSAGKYPLSSFTGQASKTGGSGSDPRYWRPDIAEDKMMTNVVTTSVSSPVALIHPSHNSSQEVLNPTQEVRLSQNQVNIHQTFRITDRDI